jgi:hypothetical protein
MEKRLVERIVEAAKTEKMQQKGSIHLAVVLDIKDEIQEALENGWCFATIWRQLQNENKFVGNYHAFRRAWGRATESVSGAKKCSGQNFLQVPSSSSVPKSKPALEEVSEPEAISGPRIFAEPQRIFSFENIKKS